jgi:hypothetical protein
LYYYYLVKLRVEEEGQRAVYRGNVAPWFAGRCMAGRGRLRFGNESRCPHLRCCFRQNRRGAGHGPGRHGAGTAGRPGRCLAGRSCRLPPSCSLPSSSSPRRPSLSAWSTGPRLICRVRPGGLIRFRWGLIAYAGLYISLITLYRPGLSWVSGT